MKHNTGGSTRCWRRTWTVTRGSQLQPRTYRKHWRELLLPVGLLFATCAHAQVGAVNLSGTIGGGAIAYGCSDLTINGDLTVDAGTALTEFRNVTVEPGVQVVLNGTLTFSGAWTVGAGSTVSGTGSAERMAFPGLTGCTTATGGPVGPTYPVATPVPTLSQWGLVSLSAALGLLGWRCRRSAGRRATRVG